MNSSYVPSCMQPKKQGSFDIRPAPEVANADELRPIVVKIRWMRSQLDTDMNAILKQARERGIDIPSDTGTLQTDPRLYNSIFSFKDDIRRGFKCHDIQMDITSLELEYKGNFIGSININILRDSWSETAKILDDPKNQGFIITVRFGPIDDPDTSIFESDDPALATTSFFKVEADGFRVDDKKLKERMDGASTSGLNEDDGTLRSFLHNSGVQLVDEVGSSPEPKKFKTPEAQREFYSGHDVETEVGKRAWQRELLTNLSDNAQATRLQLNKLPADLDDEQVTTLIAAEEARQ